MICAISYFLIHFKRLKNQNEWMQCVNEVQADFATHFVFVSSTFNTYYLFISFFFSLFIRELCSILNNNKILFTKQQRWWFSSFLSSLELVGVIFKSIETFFFKMKQKIYEYYYSISVSVPMLFIVHKYSFIHIQCSSVCRLHHNFSHAYQAK